MKTRILVILFFLFMGISGCHDSFENKIEHWELINNRCKVSETINISEKQTFSGQDSLEILQKQYSAKLELKINELKKQMDSIENKMKKAKAEFSTIKNPLMQKAYILGVNKLEYKYHQMQTIDSIYKNHPEQTQFGLLQKQIDYYKQNKDKVLGFVVEVQFIGQQGSLPQKTYRKKYFVAYGEIINGWSIGNINASVFN